MAGREKAQEYSVTVIKIHTEYGEEGKTKNQMSVDLDSIPGSVTGWLCGIGQVVL